MPLWVAKNAVRIARDSPGARCGAYDHRAMQPLPHPGLAKARAPALSRPRKLALYAVRDSAWRLAFDAADVVSEGRTEGEAGRQVYYGSTSVLLPFGRTEPVTAAEIESAWTAQLDPHLRVRALRIARREAIFRAGAELDCVHAELTVTVTQLGLRVAIDVVAYLLARQVRTGA